MLRGEGSVEEEVVMAKDYEHGTSVRLTAVPEDGWELKEWIGDLTGTTNPE